MRRLNIKQLIAMGILLFPLHAAQAFVVVGHESEPFYFTDGSKGIQGACYEIIQQLCKLEARHCKFKIAPLRLALSMIKKGEADLGCPLINSPPRNSAFSFSRGLFKTHLYFYGLPNVAHKIQKYEDLKGLSVGVQSPSMIEVSLQRIHEFSDKSFKIMPENTAILALRKVEKKNYQLAYVSGEMARVWLKRTHSPVIEVPQLGEDTEYSIFFSRKTISEKQFNKLQSHLTELSKNRFLDSIAEKYQLTPLVDQ
ncbi:substrate-binding periplasmic protein [Bdellovibrio sp.]|uniref:substrate-binding periplasmic protein n=1 Tax=Bdellovibrio sp. TaxID=28201 RepID=UPI0039E6102E